MKGSERLFDCSVVQLLHISTAPSFASRRGSFVEVCRKGGKNVLASGCRGVSDMRLTQDGTTGEYEH